MEEIKKDLHTFGIDVSKLESLTVQEVRAAYHKLAKEIHPDRVDPADAERVAECTAAFQEVGNSYQRILKFIIDKLQKQNDDSDDSSTNDEEVFAKENFGKFNFPYQNRGSFTVKVEDNLAEAWQDCLENTYGKPRIVKNDNGTETNRIWKIMFGLNEGKIEITLHFYNHNKPKDKKQSKMLIQGGVQSAICDFVFGDLPEVYKKVCSRKPSLLTPIQNSKRRRLSTSVKKRNMRYKPAAKPAEIDCALCDFKSVSKVKIIKHMKTSHTEANKPSLAPKVLAEDMSVCEISDDEDVTDRGEKLLTESKSCVTCEFEAKQEADLDEHHKECHSQPSVNLDEVAEKSPPTVKPIHLYKCNDCSFTTVTTDELQEHKKNKHKREKTVVSETVFLHSCISCDFRTNEYNSLRLHIDCDHRPTNQTSPVNIEEKPRNSQFVNTDCVTCPFCNLKSKNLDELKTHFDNVHSDNKSKKNNKQDEIKSVSSDVCSNCSKCKFSGNKSE